MFPQTSIRVSPGWTNGLNSTLRSVLTFASLDSQISQNPVPATSLLLGVRSTGRRAHISPVSKTALVRHLLTNSIIGIGLYQGLEYLLQKSFGESIRHLSRLFSRAYSNSILFRHARVYRFLIGRDVDQNYECLRDFLLHQNENSAANEEPINPVETEILLELLF